MQRTGRGHVEEVPESPPPPTNLGASVLLSPMRPTPKKKKRSSAAAPAPGAAAAPPKRTSSGSHVLTLEQVARQYGTCVDDVVEFAQFLDVDPVAELALLPTVCACINAELPEGWQECEDPKSGESYYWNRKTDETAWEHPLDAGFRRQIAAQRERLARESTAKPRRATAGAARTASGEDMYTQGKKLLGAKEYGKAIAVFTAAIATDHPEMALCHNLRGVCHSWLGKHEDALRDAERALKLRPSATLYCNRGKAYRALKRYKEARADLNEALRRNPNHAHALAELKSLATLDGGPAEPPARTASNSSTGSAAPAASPREADRVGGGKELEDWSVAEVQQWFSAKFAFAHKYQAMWCAKPSHPDATRAPAERAARDRSEQCISGALLPYLTETELRDDVQMSSSIHRNAVLRAIKSLSSGADASPVPATTAAAAGGRASGGVAKQPQQPKAQPPGAGKPKRDMERMVGGNASDRSAVPKPSTPPKVAKSEGRQGGVAQTAKAAAARSQAAAAEEEEVVITVEAEDRGEEGKATAGGAKQEEEERRKVAAAVAAATAAGVKMQPLSTSTSTSGGDKEAAAAAAAKPAAPAVLKPLQPKGADISCCIMQGERGFACMPADGVRALRAAGGSAAPGVVFSEGAAKRLQNSLRTKCVHPTP